MVIMIPYNVHSDRLPVDLQTRVHAGMHAPFSYQGVPF